MSGFRSACRAAICALGATVGDAAGEKEVVAKTVGEGFAFPGFGIGRV